MPDPPAGEKSDGISTDLMVLLRGCQSHGCLLKKNRFFMPPTSKKLTGNIGFGFSVRSSRTVHARVLKFLIWIPHGKIVDARFFFLSGLSPFLELCLFEKIWMKSDACHILRTMHARVLKFHIRIPHGKIADQYFFFLSELSPYLELCPFEKIRMKSCQQDISKSIWAKGLKLGQLIGDDE